MSDRAAIFLLFCVLLLAVSPRAEAVPATYSCTCGVDDGQFQATDSITMDTAGTGDTSDWNAVLADIDQVVCDDSSGNDEDGDGVVDRDTPVQSTGRDLEAFAFGWDQAGSLPDMNSAVKFFTGRYASTSNVQSFAYYGDVDNNFLLDSTDIVLGVTWKGSNRTVSVGIYQYSPSSPGGDCLHETTTTGGLCNGEGFVDGYNMPGTFTFQRCSSHATFNNSKCEAQTGEAGGVQMEFAVTWADILLNDDNGNLPGYPIIFHVSSSNASLGAASWPAQIDDNLGGCGGKWGSSQTVGVTCLLRGNSQQVSLGTPPPADDYVEISHDDYLTEMPWFLLDITNDSNGDDSFSVSIDHPTWTDNLGATGAVTPELSLYLDDGDGVFEPGGDDAPAITDTNGAATTFEFNTGTMSTTQTDSYFLQVEIPAPINDSWDPDGVSDITWTLASDYKPTATAGQCTVDLDARARAVPDLSVMKMVSTVSDPMGLGTYQLSGSVMQYTVTTTNLGGASPDTATLDLRDTLPVGNAELFVDNLTCSDTDSDNAPICLSDDGAAAASGLTLVYNGFTDHTDDIDFCAEATEADCDNAVGDGWQYEPTSTGGYDANVTFVRVRPSGDLNPTTSVTDPDSPSFTLTYRIRVE